MAKQKDGLLVGILLVGLFWVLFASLAPANEAMFPQSREYLILLITLSAAIGIFVSMTYLYMFGTNYQKHKTTIYRSIIGFYSAIAVSAVLVFAIFIGIGVTSQVAGGESLPIAIIGTLFGGFLVTMIFFVPIFGIWYGFISTMMVIAYLIGYGLMLGAHSLNMRFLAD